MSKGGIGAQASLLPAGDDQSDDGLPPEKIERLAATAHADSRREGQEGDEPEVGFMSLAREHDAAISQLQGQLGQVEQALPQYTAYLQQLDQRMTVMARQIVRNARRDALELAIKAGEGKATTSDVMHMAEEFLKFLDPEIAAIPVTPPPPAEGFEEGPVEPSATTH